MPLFSTVTVDKDAVRAAVEKHWGLSLGDCLKASQNHTFKATDGKSGRQYAVRVTPDVSGELHTEQRISDELTLVRYIRYEKGLTCVCAPVAIAADADKYLIREDTLLICVWEWARGEAVDFMAYKWLTDVELIKPWGACLADIHTATQQFAEAHPEVAKRMRRWDEIHEKIMAGSELHAADAAAMGADGRTCSKEYGILHGDLNISNFFFVAEDKTLSVFDWDQVHLGWWEWDIAQCAIAALMLQEGGSLPAGNPVPEADAAAFLNSLVQGYEARRGEGFVNRDRLRRMLNLRKQFYCRFCTQAQKEGAPPDMSWFIDYVVRWMEKCPPTSAAE